MYYKVIAYLEGSTERITVIVNGNELHDYIKFITDNVEKLFVFYVLRHTL